MPVYVTQTSVAVMTSPTLNVSTSNNEKDGAFSASLSSLAASGTDGGDLALFTSHHPVMSATLRRHQHPLSAMMTTSSSTNTLPRVFVKTNGAILTRGMTAAAAAAASAAHAQQQVRRQVEMFSACSDNNLPA